MTFPPEVSLVDVPPQRTDSGEAATPYLQVTEKYAEPGGTKMSRAEMYEYLLAQYGSKCKGCDRTFDDSRYLELDHNTPRSDGGLKSYLQPHTTMQSMQSCQKQHIHAFRTAKGQ